MKDLLRMAIFGVLGLALIILLVILFIPKERGAAPQPTSRYIPGTYTSSIILNGQPVDVSVTVTDNDITGVEMTAMDRVQRTFYPLFEPSMADLAAEVLYYQSAEIATGGEHPVTTGILQQAITAALARASVD